MSSSQEERHMFTDCEIQNYGGIEKYDGITFGIEPLSNLS